MNKNQIEALRRKANANARKVLRALGVKGVDYGERLVACCPVSHKDSKTPNDNQTAFNWVFDRGIWRCFSNHCQNEYGVDIIALIRSVKGYHGKSGFAAAVNWLCLTLEVKQAEIEEVSAADMEAVTNMIRRRSELKRHSALEEAMFKHLKHCTYLIDRGFLPETLADFKANGSWHTPGTYGYNRLIVPIYDPLDEFLIGFTGRTLMTDEEIKVAKERGKRIVKWLHCRNFAQEYKKSSERPEEDRFLASHILFHLHRAKKHMSKPKTIFITEGPLDVMRMWEAGSKNAVAVLGSSLSKQQKELLHRVGAQQLVVCFDSDAAGNKAYESLAKLCGNYFDVQRVELPEGKDPGDLDAIQLRHYLREYV